MRVVEGGIERVAHAPANFIGRLVACDPEFLQMNEGRATIVSLRVADIAPFLGGDEAAARILGDAVAHHDLATIGVHDGRITYDNDAQLERAERAAAHSS